VIVLTVMMCFVMPRFTGLFETLDVPLPPTTKALMGVSQFIITWWWLVILAIGAASGALAFWLRTAAGRSQLHLLLVRAPQFGKITRGMATARFARLMGLLLESRVPMLECLELTRDA